MKKVKTEEELKKEAYEYLKQLQFLVSNKMWSHSADNKEAQAELHSEILKEMNFIQGYYKVSNRTINHVLSLSYDRNTNHFKAYFNSIFKVEDIKICPNMDINMLVTIC